MIFLIEYDRARGALVQIKEFTADEAGRANSSRLRLELERMQSNVDREIVLLDAESERDVRKTHRRYFEPLRELANPDAALVALKAA